MLKSWANGSVIALRLCLMPRRRRDVLRGLRRKGFTTKNRRHLTLTFFGTDGGETEIVTMVSHGSDFDIGNRLLAEMARQLHLTRREFDELIDCGLSQDDYEAMMRRDGFIR